MSEDKFGNLVRALADVPCDMHGVVGDILARLSGSERQYWRHVFMRANQRKNPFENNVNATLLELLPETTTKIYGQSRGAITKRGPFTPRWEDKTSPFGSLDTKIGHLLDEPTKTVSVRGFRVCEDSFWTDLVHAAGGKEEICAKHCFTPSQIRLLVDRQTKGEKGPMLTDGPSNLFFVKTVEGRLVVLVVYWHLRFSYWCLALEEITDHLAIITGCRLFLRAT